MSSNEEEYVADGVLGDDQQAQDPIDSDTANANASIGSDEVDSMDESNIVEGRTRGAAKEKGAYSDPDEENIDEDAQGNLVIKD